MNTHVSSDSLTCDQIMLLPSIQSEPQQTFRLFPTISKHTPQDQEADDYNSL